MSKPHNSQAGLLLGLLQDRWVGLFKHAYQNQ
jgi:hypothetical protein